MVVIIWATAGYRVFGPPEAVPRGTERPDSIVCLLFSTHGPNGTLLTFPRLVELSPIFVTLLCPSLPREKRLIGETRVCVMVGMMVASSREKASDLLNSAKFATEAPSKLKSLRLFKDLLFQRNPLLLPEFVPRLLELQTDRFSPVRKFLAE